MTKRQATTTDAFHVLVRFQNKKEFLPKKSSKKGPPKKFYPKNSSNKNPKNFQTISQKIPNFENI